MKGLKTAILIIVVLVFCSTAYSREGAVPAHDKTATAKEDDLLPIYKEGWQFFVAPYVWIPGANINLARQGRFSGTTTVDVPWYNIVPLLFSQAIGGMGRVEIWHGRWGFFSDTVFIYYSGHLIVLTSSGGVPHMFSMKIFRHDMRLHLAFTEIAPDIFDQFVLLAGAIFSDGIALHVLVE
jgi:hypothetical protein